MSVIYTCGRMQKRRALKHYKKCSGDNAIITVFTRIMQDELGKEALEKVIARLADELDCSKFSSNDARVVQKRISPVPHVWIPAKPKVTIALLDDLLGEMVANPQSQAPAATVGTTGTVSKFLARHAVDRVYEMKGVEWFKTSGELNHDQCEHTVKLKHAVSRVAFDLLVYVHARSLELQQEEDAQAVLELHSSDQTLVGKAMRGCGIVCCATGRVLFARAASRLRETILRGSRSPSMNEEPGNMVSHI